MHNLGKSLQNNRKLVGDLVASKYVKITCIIYYARLHFVNYPMKAVFSSTFLPLLLLCFLNAQAWAIQSKGAIIIASMEGEVSVTNNETGVALSSDRVKVGGLIFDGHTVSTGPDSKAVLLFSSGTITTLKADSVLNIKKFAQEKFDPKAAGKLGDRKDEPSPSETVIDLNLGDMVVDVKKLKKESSFNIDSPVGTAGIRGTVPAIQVFKLPDGGFTQNTSMLRGEIAFTPRAGGPSTFLGPGQSLSIGIGANGLMLPAQLGRVDASVMKAIEAEVEQAAAASGAAPADNEQSGETPQGASEEDAPSEDELNESDDERQASAKGVGDDENSTDAVALEKAGLIDLDDADQKSKVGSYVEVTAEASMAYAEKLVDTDGDGVPDVEDSFPNDPNRRTRRNVSGEDSENSVKDGASFISSLKENINDVVDVTVEAEALGIKDEAMFDSLLESSENAGAVKEVVKVAADLDAKDSESLGSVFQNVDKAADLKEVMDVARDALGSDDGSGSKKLDASKKSILSSTLKNADKADKVKKIVTAATDTFKDTSSSSDSAVTEDGKGALTAVFRTADQAEKVVAVVESADGQDVDKSKKLNSLFTVVKKVDAKKQASQANEEIKNTASQSLSAEIKTALESATSAKAVDALVEEYEADLALASVLDKIKTFANGVKEDLSFVSSFSNIETVVELTETVLNLKEQKGESDTSFDDDAVLDNLLAYADQAEDLKEVVTTASTSGASANLDKVLQNADKASDLKTLSEKAKSTGDSGESTFDADLLDSVFENADKASDLKEVVDAFEVSQEEGTTVDVSNLLANADKTDELKKLSDEVKKIQDAGDTTAARDLFKNVADNAANADVLSEVVESANESGATGSVRALIKNADKAEAFKAAKDNAGGDAGKVATLFKVIEKVDNNIPADGGSGTEIDAFDSLDALVEVAETLVGEDGNLDSIEVFDDIIENVEQVEQIASALEEDVTLINDLKSVSEGETFDIQTAVKNSAVGKLNSRFDAFPEYKSVISSNEERAGDLQFILNHPAVKDIPSREAAVFNNFSQLDSLLSLNKALGEGTANVDKVGYALDNISTLSLSDLAGLSNNLKFQPSKLNQVFDDLDNLSFYKDLVTAYLDKPKRLDKIFQNTASLETIHDLALSEDRFKGNEDEISLLFNNLDKVDDLAKIAEQFEGDKRISILSQVKKLSFNYKNDPAKRDKIFANPEQVPALYDLLSRDYIKSDLGRVQKVFDYAEKADAFLAVLDDLRGENGTGSFQILFSDTDNTLKNQGLAKLKSDYDSKYHSVFDENVDIAAEISATASKFKDNPDRLDLIFNNIDKIADINKFSNEFSGDEARIAIFFSLIDDLDNFKAFKQIAFDNGIAGGVALDIYSSEPGYLQLGQLDGKFLGELYRTGINLSQIPLKLAQELQTLSLTRAELKQVVSDLINGPENTTPETSPIDEGKSGSPEFATLSFLLDHDFSGLIREDLVVSANTASASSFFREILQSLEGLDALSVSTSFATPTEILNSANEIPQNPSTEDSSDLVPISLEMLGFGNSGVLGGRKLKFSAGEYDLSLLSYDELLFASSDSIALNGKIAFGVGQNDVRNELILLSAGGISFGSGTSINYNGEILGFGSFNSMEIIDVNLYAEDEIHARSLDSIVINNSDMETSGRGADFVHLLAYNELAVNNLAFSEQIRQITMEAMTVNLYNLNFPDGSMVKLNSQHGGIDGKYPNFNSSVYGRVNFVENIRYSSNLIMDRPSFDQYGTNVTIGQLGQ